MVDITIVHGGYILVYKHFINQHSHNWGAPSCTPSEPGFHGVLLMNLVTVAARGEAKFPDGTLKPLADYVHSKARRRLVSIEAMKIMKHGDVLFQECPKTPPKPSTQPGDD